MLLLEDHKMLTDTDVWWNRFAIKVSLCWPWHSMNFGRDGVGIRKVSFASGMEYVIALEMFVINVRNT